MGKYILRRILVMIPVLIGVTLLIFVLMDLAPGDPGTILLPDTATQEEIDAINEQFGLNEPLLVQWGKYLYGIVIRLDFGISYKTARPVTEAILQRYPTTILVALLGVAFTTILGLSLGIISAVKQNSIWDNLATAFGMIGVSMPSFFFGLVLIYIFAHCLKLLPASGNDGWEFFILPIATISLQSCASLMRLTRSSMLEVMRQDYIRTARAKGQNEKVVILHHALKNAVIPLITQIGTQAGILLGGTMIVEQIFSIPGVGKLMIDSISYRDYPMIRGSVLLIAFSFSVINLLIDIAYAIADPRIYERFSGGKSRTERRGKKHEVVS